MPPNPCNENPPECNGTNPGPHRPAAAAFDTIARLRTTVHAVPGADALVGGQSAATLDVHDASVHDRNLIIPIVLVVIFGC